MPVADCVLELVSTRAFPPPSPRENGGQLPAALLLLQGPTGTPPRGGVDFF
jgi:hypothetical protein